MKKARQIVAALTALLLVGCRASPAPDSGFFADGKLLKNDPSLPFNRVWVNTKYAGKPYTELFVAKVNTDYVMKENLWEMISLTSLSPDYVAENVRMMADYQRAVIIEAAQNDPHHQFTVVDKPGPHTLILEMAIVQLVPSKAELQAASYYTWISSVVMLGLSTATQSEDQGKGVIAMEARTRDGATGELTSEIADREHPPTALIDVKALFWWEPAKPICAAWARQIVQMQCGPKGTKIEEIPNFQWLIW